MQVLITARSPCTQVILNRRLEQDRREVAEELRDMSLMTRHAVDHRLTRDSRVRRYTQRRRGLGAVCDRLVLGPVRRFLRQPIVAHFIIVVLMSCVVVGIAAILIGLARSAPISFEVRHPAGMRVLQHGALRARPARRACTPRTARSVYAHHGALRACPSRRAPCSPITARSVHAHHSAVPTACEVPAHVWARL